MDSEASSSILFERKPGAARIRKHFRRQNPEGTSIIRKIVRGENLSKKQSEKISNSILNEFSPIIPYSLNKQKRWQTLGNVDAILNSVESKNCIVSAAKRTQKPSKEFKVDVYGRIKPGNDSEVEKIKCQGNGCVVESLADSLDCLKDGKTKKKDKNVEKVVEPEVTVLIDPNCEDWRLFARGESILGKTNFIGKSKMKKSNKMGRLMDGDEDNDEEVHSFENGEDSDDEKNERSSKFNLADFVVKDFGITSKNRDRLPTTNTLDEFEMIEDLDTIIKAIDEATETKNKNFPPVILPNSGTMMEVIITERKLNFTADNFADCLESFINENPAVILYWKNGAKNDCILDFSGLIQWGKFNVIIGFTILETKFPFLRMTMNSTFPLNYPTTETPYASFCDSISHGRFKNVKKEHLFFYHIVDFIKKQYYLQYPVVQPSYLDRKEKPFEIFSKVSNRNYPVVISLFEMDLLKMAQESVTKNSEFYSSDSKKICDLCDQEWHQSLNGFEQNCGHNLCKSCSNFIFNDQIKSLNQNLACPICEEIQDPFNLVTVLPLTNLHVFLRNHFEKNAKFGIVECKKCEGIFEKIPETHGIHCQKCQYVFCQDCHEVPHFPLTCSQFKIWKEKFTEQFFWSTLKTILPYLGCPFCHVCVNPERDELGLYTCKLCGRKLLPGKTYDYGYKLCRFVVKPILPIPTAPELPKVIPERFLDPHWNIREEIKNKKLDLEIKKQINNFLTKKESVEFMHIRIEILDFLAFGTAWLYVERHNAKTKNWQTIKKSIQKLSDDFQIVINFVLKNVPREKVYGVKLDRWTPLLGRKHYFPKPNPVRMPKPRPITSVDKVIFKRYHIQLMDQFLECKKFFE